MASSVRLRRATRAIRGSAEPLTDVATRILRPGRERVGGFIHRDLVETSLRLRRRASSDTKVAVKSPVTGKRSAMGASGTIGGGASSGACMAGPARSETTAPLTRTHIWLRAAVIVPPGAFPANLIRYEHETPARLVAMTLKADPSVEVSADTMTVPSAATVSMPPVMVPPEHPENVAA